MNTEELKAAMKETEETWECMAEAGNAYASHQLCQQYHSFKEQLEKLEKNENN
jgi:hypothetical protein